MIITIHIRNKEDLYKYFTFRDKLKIDVKSLVWDNHQWREASYQDIEDLQKTWAMNF